LQPVIRSTSGVQKPAAAAPVSTQAVFTVGQASRGEQLYNQACAACHNAADQTGSSLRARWGNSTLGDLFKLISTTMPENAPGSLPPADYASILAFLLSRSGYPPGAAELPGDAAALSSVRIEPPPR
jgi:alcohol dehydrogenase (cytochrome c)